MVVVYLLFLRVLSFLCFWCGVGFCFVLLFVCVCIFVVCLGFGFSVCVR